MPVVDQDGIFGIFLSIRMSIRMDNARGTGVVPFSYLIIWRGEISRNAPSAFWVNPSAKRPVLNVSGFIAFT